MSTVGLVVGRTARAERFCEDLLVSIAGSPEIIGYLPDKSLTNNDFSLPGPGRRGNGMAIAMVQMRSVIP